jgi:exodeoxyribonuclease-3
MKLATWNVNGIKARIDAVPEWLRQAEPDVVVLQEIKSVDEGFPRQPFEDLGYNVQTHGQKGFNGVAILSKRPLDSVTRGLPGDESDEQARWIEATVSGDAGALTVCGLYQPNGNPAPGAKYDYKLSWMARMELRAAALLALEEPVAMLGDYNVIPQPEDAYDPTAWEEDALYRVETRDMFRRLMAQGWTDAIRATDPTGERFTFWDYQAGAWPKNNGIRIDHILLSPQAADLLGTAAIDRDVRSWEKPSDHVPVWCTLSL